MRVVIDTNVLVSGLIWHGTPHTLMEQVRSGTLTLVSSPALFAELAEVIERPKFHRPLARSGMTAGALMAELRQLAELIDPPPLPEPVSRDLDDDAVLALAIAAQADLIISGDDDLLTLATHAGIPIVDPAEALARLAQ